VITLKRFAGIKAPGGSVVVDSDRGSSHFGFISEGMLDGFTLGNYLMLVEYTGRMLRDGKATIAAEVRTS
jgi:hypothetical protein